MSYLDHAATSYPKPACVTAAIARWYDEVGVSADRGDGPRQRDARQTVAAARALAGALCGHDGDRVAFVSGATEGLNLALRAMLPAGARVLTTRHEHSSVVRVLTALRAERGLEVAVVDDDRQLCAALADRPADVVVHTHASNVTGDVFDAAAVAAAARSAGARVVLDASQTAGYLPLAVGADVTVFSAHKALHGPPGLGCVVAAPHVPLAPQKQGGTGSSAALDQHPTAWPHAFEAGTPNTPAIYGLLAALRWLDEQTPAALLRRALHQTERLRAGLAALDGVRVLPTRAERTPVVSFVPERYDVLEVGAILAGAGVQARAGFHCAPWAHALLGTEAGGTVRLSPGPHTTDAEVDAALAVLGAL